MRKDFYTGVNIYRFIIINNCRICIYLKVLPKLRILYIGFWLFKYAVYIKNSFLTGRLYKVERKW